MASFSEMPIYIGLLLLPYISYTDVFRCQRVCKHWYEVFGSRDLSRTALLVYGPRSFENMSLLRTSGQQSDASSLFRRYCRRDCNLRLGISHQELRLEAKRAWTGRFLWGLSNNALNSILVYMSPAYREGLTCVVFDHEKGRYKEGTMNLGPRGTLTVRSLKLFRNMVAAEHSSENSVNDAEGRRKASYFLCEVQIFRISEEVAEGESEGIVTCTKMSRFVTFQFKFVDYFESIISDLSSTHYAALNLRYTGTRALGLYVWNTTGSLVYHLPIDKTQIEHTLHSHCESVVMCGDSRVIISSGDVRNKGKFKDIDHEEAAFRVNVRTVSINEGDADDEGVIVGRPNDGVRNTAQILKGDPLVKGYGYNIHWRTIKQVKPGYDSNELQVSLNLWGRISIHEEGSERKDHAQVLQYDLLPHNDREGELKCNTIYSHISQRNPLLNNMMDQSYAEQKLSGVPFYINSTDGMSFSMPFSGKSIEVFGTRLIGYNFLARKFRPSEGYEKATHDQAARYTLDFSSQLRSFQDKTKVRVIPSINRNVIGRGISGDHKYGMEIAGDERMTVYSELKEENGLAALVANVWTPVTFSPTS